MKTPRLAIPSLILAAVSMLSACASSSSTPVESPTSAEPSAKDATPARTAAATSDQPAASAPSAAPTPVPEVRPGFLAGYLPVGSLPDSSKLLPPPPADGSAVEAADLELHNATLPLRSGPRWKLATLDADLTFPNAAGTYSCAVGAPISETATPRLYQLLRRTLADAGAATGAAKRAHMRVRPFVELGEASCSPGDESYLRNDGSYPSGHSSIGWSWALLLAELAPDRNTAILARGLEYGHSRVICGVHWPSDVAAGRVVGSGVVAQLHNDPTFRADFEAARLELAAARGKQLPPSRDCAAETAALAQGLP